MIVAARNHREARRKFKELIAAGEIAWTDHAKERMLEYDILTGEVIRVLKAGHEVEGPIRDPVDWKCTFAGNSAGVGVRVVAVLIEQGTETCLIVTVID
jgi:Domain of unknown function (DUF4258)